MASLPQIPRQVVALLRRTPALVFAMAVLGAGLTVAGSVAVKGLRSANDTITVTGSSTERITSDFADWTVVVSVAAASQQQAYRALQPAVQTTVTFLRGQGIPSGAIELANVKSEQQQVRDPRTGDLRSVTWSSSQAVKVSSPNVRRVQAVAGAIGSLIGQGVPLTINEPAYTYTRLAEKRVDMLAKATRDARQRAVAIAREAGSGIGPITRADTGTFQITVPNSTELGSYGSYDTSTIEKDITAVIGVTFRVQ
ncbi:MAG: SIMPL domain-containing protein [Cyanobacteriota bacterium]